jgi:cobalamin-dependent methionine synthase I
MGWKEDFSKQLDVVERLLRVLQGQTAINSKRIEAMRVIIEQSEKTRSRAADRMADRLVEMAMVNQGKAVEAASHRRSLEENPEAEAADPWQDSPDTQWPPPGCDAIQMP